MNAEIIGIGTELLLGQIANTNAQTISQSLSTVGINVYFHTAVGDNRSRILEALSVAKKRADLIITTGGLGPTLDDLSKETLAEFLGLSLTLHEPSLEHIRGIFARRGRKMPDSNHKQAMFPKEARILPNPNGTAPGAILEQDGRIYVLLPGPPSEMQPMFEASVLPFLLDKSGEKIVSRVLRLIGIGESAVEELVKDLLECQGNPTLAPLAGTGEVTLRITAKVARTADAAAIIAPMEQEIRRRLHPYVYGCDDDRLESVVVRLLKGAGKSLALAESCTGGLLGHRITNVSGASEVFLEAAVCYSNQAKMERLGVSRNTLQAWGAVSAQTAAEMAQGIRRSGADIGAAITGIAGPGGGTLEKPVGLVYLAVADEKGTETKEVRLVGDRLRIKESAADQMLNWLRLRLSEGQENEQENSNKIL